MTSALDGLEKVVFEKGEHLFAEGDESYFFFIIQQGEVDVYLPKTKTAEEIHLATLGPGQPVGEFALVVKKTRSASARARTTCTAIKISESSYKALLKELPPWCISVMESLIERLRRTDGMLRDQRIQKALMLSKIEQIIGG
jgi:CRP/FNR family transcriptional regulator, cyclic AMP receptor protein